PASNQKRTDSAKVLREAGLREAGLREVDKEAEADRVAHLKVVDHVLPANKHSLQIPNPLDRPIAILRVSFCPEQSDYACFLR
ncbi:hypothetical protein N9195_02135, partial [bacterium]|nr:hypothetical protein [bacterium]